MGAVVDALIPALLGISAMSAVLVGLLKLTFFFADRHAVHMWSQLTDEQKAMVRAEDKRLIGEEEDNRRQDERHWMY